MEAYTGFAQVYDLFMDNIPYEEWAQYLHGLLKEYQIEDGLVLDLGCGTGTMTELLAKEGYDMIGIDNAPEMLEIANRKKEASRRDILYLLQDMREFELYGTVRAIVSICDSVNYVTEPKELQEVFRLVNNYLDPEGIFIFDFNTQYKYRELLGDRIIAENREESSFIWENFYYEEEKINEYALTIFVKDPTRQQEQSEGTAYLKFEETHFQRAYTVEEIKELVEMSGLQFVAAYDAFTKEAPKPDSERVYLIAREHGKGKKQA